MRMPASCIAVCALVVGLAAPARAQTRALTLAEVLARAREQAPRIVSARLALEEARGRLAGASVRLQANPEVDAAVGTRRGDEARFTDFELGVGQSFEPGSRRSARVAGANAAIAQASAHVDDVARLVMREAAAAFHRAVYAGDRIRLLDAALDVAIGIHAAADRRFQAGDVAVLDVNLARATLTRLRAEREGVEASRALALGELRALLRLDGDLDVAGSLAPPGGVDLAGALSAADARPEIRALEAGVQEAEAESRLGDALAKPQYGVGLRYAREEGDQILLGALTVTLPIFSKGQESRAIGAARAARLRAELDAARARVTVEVRAAFEAFTRRLAAARLLEAEALPALDENERLSARSFEVGQIGLPDLLVIRREILETRLQYLDALLEAALARTELDASAGIMR